MNIIEKATKVKDVLEKGIGGLVGSVDGVLDSVFQIISPTDNPVI